MLNVADIPFFCVPDLYCSPSLQKFRAVVVERGAVDHNDANVAAWPGMLADYVRGGGLAVVFAQQNESWLEETFPALEGMEGDTAEIVFGRGRVVCYKTYPEINTAMDENARVSELKKFADKTLEGGL